MDALLREGTRVLMSDNFYKNIEDIIVGDCVLSFNPVLDLMMPFQVLEVFVGNADRWVDLELSGHNDNTRLVCTEAVKVFSVGADDYKSLSLIDCCPDGSRTINFNEKIGTYVAEVPEQYKDLGVKFFAQLTISRDIIDRLLPGYMIRTESNSFIANNIMISTGGN